MSSAVYASNGKKPQSASAVGRRRRKVEDAYSPLYLSTMKKKYQ